MLEDLKTRAEEAVTLAKRHGADDVFAWARRGRSVEFTYRDGSLEKVAESTSRALSVQIYADGRYSSHSTTDLRPDSLDTFLRDAVALTRALQPDPHRALPDASLYPEQAPLGEVDADVVGLDQVRRASWCAEMDERIRGQDGVISVTSGVWDGHNLTAGVSSNGFQGQHQTASVWYGTSVTLKDEGDRRPEEGCWAGSRVLRTLPPAVDLADLALRLARARLGADKGPTMRTTLIVDPRAAGRLIGALFRSADASLVQQDRSFWKGRTGEKLFSPQLTVIDDPLLENGLASRPFDGEGIAARALPLVEAGVVRDLYVDTYYGRKLGLAPTTGSPSNRVVAPGDQDLAGLMAAAGTGIYVTSWLGGNSDDNTGDFSFGLRGHRIQNGQVGAPVGEMNVTGNLVDLFSRLTAVGNDPWPWSSTLAPTLVFEGVQFSGA